MQYPKFEQKIKETIVQPALGASEANGIGVVLAYYPRTNTVDIVANQLGSNLMGEIYKGVQCPISNGVQGVAPGIGIMCRLAFRSRSQTQPYILSFFDNNYEQYSYDSQNYANNETPRFLGLI